VSKKRMRVKRKMKIKKMKTKIKKLKKEKIMRKIRWKLKFHN
jgi:hypothetical protein